MGVWEPVVMAAGAGDMARPEECCHGTPQEQLPTQGECAGAACPCQDLAYTLHVGVHVGIRDLHRSWIHAGIVHLCQEWASTLGS